MISVARKKGLIFTLYNSLWSQHILWRIFSIPSWNLGEFSREVIKSHFSPIFLPRTKDFLSPGNKRTNLWRVEEKKCDSMWHPKHMLYFIFFTETIQSPSTVSSKTHHALNNGFETRHYLEFNVLLFWGTICTIVIGQPGLVCVALVWKHSKSGLQLSELGEILLLGDTGPALRTVQEN